jgi:hypothetical protein
MTQRACTVGIASAVFGILALLVAGCESKAPAAKSSPVKSGAVASAPSPNPVNPLITPSPVPVPVVPQPTPDRSSNSVVPATPAPSPPPTPPGNPAFQLTAQQILNSIEIGPGNFFDPENGERIVWLSLNVKGTGSGPLTVDLAAIKLTADGANYDVRGVGFAGADPSVQHLIDPAIMQSGTVTTSGPAIGEVVYDTGAKQVTFQTLPSRMTLMFLVPGEPGKMSLSGLPGGDLPVK